MINSMKKRLAVFLIIPVALLLAAAGTAGFIYARSMLLDQWQQGAILKLERAAHYMDMRLGRPIDWIQMFHATGSTSDAPAAREFIINRIKGLDGVAAVDLQWADNLRHPGRAGMHADQMSRKLRMRFHHADISRVTAPRYDAGKKAETVTLVSELRNKDGGLVGRLSVSVRFDHLMQDIKELGWWQSNQVCLVDESGQYLAHSAAMEKREQLGATGDPLEKALLEKMQESPFGTHLGSGHPPHLVGGFYRLERAPWVLIMYAPGREILAPILEFRLYYVVAAGICIAFTLLLIQLVGGRLVRQIGRISRAVREVAEGRYPERLSETSADEIGQLEAGFNEMVEGLRERDFIRDTFGRYMDREVAHELMKRPEARRLGGEKREVVILMSDIRGFTAVSESLSPEATIGVLNRYFSHMIEVIHQYKGIIVDFYGDGVLVFFDPQEGQLEPAAARAVQCSLEMQRTMSPFNRHLRQQGLPEMQTGIGVHAGQVVVGNIGSSTRAKYGIVGLAVNMTQRIQAEAEGGGIVISEPVYNLLADGLTIENAFTAHLKGVQEKATLYVLEDFRVPPGS
ncbi:MAG: HAMP domain-containing protein [Desulfobacteraceae bacterium]|nr:HAMP domain-containing protein [Desulfobacteraceae bacterium]